MSLKKRFFILGITLVILTSCGESKSTIVDTTTDTAPSYEENFLEAYKSVDTGYRVSESFNVCLESNINYCFQKTVQENAFKTKDILICDDLKDETIKKECIDSIVSFKARESKNLDSCNEIDGNEQMNCKYSIASQMAIEQQDVDICDNISATGEVTPEIEKAYVAAQTNCKHNIYSSIAISEGNSALCIKISNRDSRVQCLEQVKNFINIKEEQEASSNNSIITEE